MEQMHPPLPASAAVVGFRVKAVSLAATAESVPGFSECCRRWLDASEESVHRDLAAEDCISRECQASLAWRLSCMAEIVSFLHPAQACSWSPVNIADSCPCSGPDRQLAAGSQAA